ncbi:MAG: HDOD domain-containing protein, partial [Gemmatimonadetes bacterium]|nr:HDOD domain-containing protein [Gemmatimonadota bacterium]
KDQGVWNDLGSISTEKPDSEPTRPKTDGDAERTLRRLFGKNINDLPTLPHVVQQVLEKTRDSEANLSDIVNLIATDQSLVTTYLKLVNSAFYGFNRRIATLKQAITLLGFRSVRNVVVNAGVVGVFRRRMFNSRNRNRLWNHSVACAVACRALAERTGYKAKEEAFTAGLLHDIGKVVIDQYAPKDSARIVAMVEDGFGQREAEEQVLGVDHTKIGSWIAERWQLPKNLCWVIEYHHDPTSDKIPANKELVQLVASANVICRFRSTDTPEELEEGLKEFVETDHNWMKFNVEQLRELLEEVWRIKSEAMKTFGPGMAGETVGEIDQAVEEETRVKKGDRAEVAYRDAQRGG